MLEELSIAHPLTELAVEPSGLLFHYTRASSLQAILESGNIRLNHLDGMNDPREKKEWVARRVVLPEGDVTSESLTIQGDILAEPERLLRRGARVACFTRERQAHPDADPAALFHRGWARARMWHQYAQEHTGACLVFDWAALAESLDAARQVEDGDLFSVSPVTYADRPLAIPLEGSYRTASEIREALDRVTDSGRNIADLFFTKNTDWQSEDEVRVLVVLWDNNPGQAVPYLDLPFGNSLRGVVLGEDFAEQDWLAGATAARGLSSEDVLRADWVDGAPKLRAV